MALKSIKKQFSDPDVAPDTEDNGGKPILLKGRALPERIRAAGESKYEFSSMVPTDQLFSKTEAANRNVTVAARAFAKRQNPPWVFQSRKVVDKEHGEGYVVVRKE